MSEGLEAKEYAGGFSVSCSAGQAAINSPDLAALIRRGCPGVYDVELDITGEASKMKVSVASAALVGGPELVRFSGEGLKFAQPKAG